MPHLLFCNGKKDTGSNLLRISYWFFFLLLKRKSCGLVALFNVIRSRALEGITWMYLDNPLQEMLKWKKRYTSWSGLEETAATSKNRVTAVTRWQPSSMKGVVENETTRIKQCHCHSPVSNHLLLVPNCRSPRYVNLFRMKIRPFTGGLYKEDIKGDFIFLWVMSWI